MVSKDAHALHGATRHTAQARALVDVGHVHGAFLHARDAAVRIDRRLGALGVTDGFAQGRTLNFAQQGHVVKDVNEVNAPKVFVAATHGGEEELTCAIHLRIGAERIGRQETRPVAIVEIVFNTFRNRLLPTRNHLFATRGFGAALGHVEEG